MASRGSDAGGRAVALDLKLAEAFITFWATASSSTPACAIDLGAAPGGWTGSSRTAGCASPPSTADCSRARSRTTRSVTHLRADGWRYVPRRPVDWLVCDIAEPLPRVAGLVARWIGEAMQRAIFNLAADEEALRRRSPRKPSCASRLPGRVRHTLVLRQLYHDREEVTGFIERPR
jgi:23S rRNA (cytidine2498-2'-O)-methyltransferase